MGFFWREWNHGDKAGVSGWDAGGYCVLLLIAAVSSIVILVALGLQWGWLGTICVLASLTFRYQLVISRDGYQLRRTCCFFPWQVRHFSKRAFIFPDPVPNDDWSDDPGRLCIGEPCELNYEQCMATADFGEPVKTIFGNLFQSELVAHRIRVLAFQVGCTEKTPENPTDVSTGAPVQAESPKSSRRARWRQRWKTKNEIN